jgi:hypothetical protein
MLEDECLRTAHVNGVPVVVQVVLDKTYLPKFVSALHSSLDEIAVLACFRFPVAFPSEIEQRKTQLHHTINN